MSRLIVKNLPPYLDEAGLKKHFSTVKDPKSAGFAPSDITDVKVVRARDGKTRRFGFVGFRSDEAAEAAVKYFDTSFINSTKISVAVAMTFTDPNVPLSSRERKRAAAQRAREDAEGDRDAKKARYEQNPMTIDDINGLGNASDPRLADYLDAMQVRSNAKTWSNNDAGAVAQEPQVIQSTASDDEYEEFTGKGDEEEEEEEDEEEEETVPMTFNKDDEEEGEDDDEEDPVIEDGLAADPCVSDMDWLRQRQTRIKEGETEEDRENRDAESKSEKKKTKAPKAAPVEEEEPAEDPTIVSIRKTGRLFLRNLLYTAKEDDFRKLFSQYGELEEVHLPVNSKTGQCKGFAHVQFEDPENAVAAYEAQDGKIFQGRLLHILPGKPKKDYNRLDEHDLKNLPLKKQQELKRKAEAAKQQFSWNSLYMNQDAVMESVAKSMGIKKSELIDPDSSDAAVKQALAEATVIGDVKSYFEKMGVDLASFDNKDRDDRVILVKNFPFGTTQPEIAEMFAEYGDLYKVMMPPAGTIAIVIFKHIPDARAAFAKLAFRRFKTSILYLEKGPKNLLPNEQMEGDEVEHAKQDKVVTIEDKLSASDVMDTGANDERPATASTSIFVKNLNFKTTSRVLTDAFKALDGFLVAQVKMKPDAKNKGKFLSMGFGFVEFSSKEDAEIAQKAMDGHVLDGHKLQLKISNRGQDEEATETKKAIDAKILIKNLPFEATKKDVQKLFGAFGSLKTVRVPKKFNSESRGFAFAEYVSAKEAEHAMSALQGTHLLGRRLVLQYAQADASNAEEEIERMQAAVSKQAAQRSFADMKLAGEGKRRVDLEGDDEEEF
ncbi:Multiple RNA-binding domain-containing protein 1 [Yarrowia sp. B02]|nr:Multiple RNA-binding domain-containing protein 1 [Yarrowia sp. B02]